VQGNRIVEWAVSNLAEIHRPVTRCGGFQSGGMRSCRSKRRHFSAVNASITPSLKIDFCSFRQKYFPFELEVRTGRVESFGCAARVFARLRSRVEVV
jgi:hypothetical protein